MKDLTQNAIVQLLTADSAEPKVTIYLPMHTSGSPPHLTQNQIRFKNFMHQAAARLRSQGADQLAEVLTAELASRLADVAFWESQTAGLLVCAQPGKLELFHLPVDTEEYLAVDTCYHLAPVLALLADEQSFYVLTVSQQHPRLFSGTMYGLFEMEVGMPESVEASLNIDEYNQRSQQSRSAGQGSRFNGRGGIRDPRREERHRFFRLVDNIVCNVAGHPLPLILAGTETETAEFRHLSKYPHIMAKTIAGSFNGGRQHELFEPAYHIIQDDVVARRHQQTLENYRRLQGTRQERISADPVAIAEAARQGRIDTLLIALRRNTTDTIRDTAKAVERLTFPRTELSALINKTANAVAAARGRIVNIELEAANAASPIMALLRY